MAERYASFANPLFDSMNAGLRVPVGKALGTPATSVGIDNLSPSAADQAVQNEPIGGSTMRALDELRKPTVNPDQKYYYPGTDQFYAGGRVFKRGDLATMYDQSAPAVAPPEGGIPIPEESFANYVNSLSQRRSAGELLGRGVKNIAYGLGTLPGTAASLAGFEETGAALRAPVESLLGESENEQIRSALIAENSTLFQKVWDTGVESVPMLVGTLLSGGVASASAASRVGLAANAASKIGRAGSMGATAFNFPIHLASMYDAAVNNNADMTSIETKAEILGGAMLSSWLDKFGIEGRLLSPIAKTAMGAAAKKTIAKRLLSGAATGLSEGSAEVAQSALETLMFDPMVRDNLAPQDWKTLVPAIVEKHGEDYAVAFLASAGMGAATGFIMPHGALAGKPKQPIDTKKPLDLNTTATQQSTPAEIAPPATPATPTGPLAIPYIPGSQTMGAVPVAPTGPEQVIDINRPMTQQQVGLMRGATGGLKPEDRQAGNAVPPGTTRPITGEIMPGVAPQGQQRLALGGPQVAGTLPPPQQPGAADFTAGPEGVAATGYTAPEVAAQPVVTPGEQLRVGMNARPLQIGKLDNPFSEKLQALFARQAVPAAAAPTAAEPVVDIEARQKATQVEDAYAQSEAQRATMYTAEQQVAYNQLDTAQKAYVDAESAWEAFRPQESGVILRDLTAKAQQEWMTAVQQGTADAALYKELRKSRPFGKASPLLDIPTILKPVVVVAPKEPTTRASATPKVNPAVVAQVNRFATLTPEQQGAVLTKLNITDPAQLETVDPKAVKAAIDSVLTSPTGGGAPKSRVLKKPVVKPAATPTTEITKVSKVRKGPLKQEAAPETQTPTPAPTAAVTVVPNDDGSIATRVTKAISGEEYDYYTVALSDNTEVAFRYVKPNWVFRETNEPIGDKLTSKTAADEIARMVSENNLPEKVATAIEAEPKPAAGKIGTGEDVMSQRDQEETLAELEQDMMSDDGSTMLSMTGGKLDAAVELMKFRDSDETPANLKLKAQEILEAHSTTDGPAALSIAEKAYDKIKDAPTGSKNISKATGLPEPVVRLGELLNIFAAHGRDANRIVPDFNTAFSKAVRAVKNLQAEGNKAALNATYQGEPILKYVSAQNEPKVKGGKLTAFALSDWNTITGAVDLDGKPVVPMSMGRIQLLVRNLASKLRNPPKTTVVKNQADLKARYPEVYARAVAERPQGDFDTANALGYSSSNGEVILFTDRIATEQQLQFVYAHETLGHFGLRGIISDAEFNSVMNKVYNSNKLIAAVIDQAVESRGMGRAEATEEYLADYAAVLDMSVLQRVGVAIKNALNKIGFKFSDDMVRYLVSQARRYVRNGKRGTIITTEKIFGDIYAIESGIDPLGTGRFKESFASDNMKTDSLIHNISMPQSLEDIRTALKPTTGKAADMADKFLTKVWSLTTFRAMDNAGLAQGARYIQEAGELSNSVRNRAAAIMKPALDMTFDALGIRMFGSINAAERAASSRLAFEAQNLRRDKAEDESKKIASGLEKAKKSPKLVYVVNGQVRRNEDAIAAYSKAGRITLVEAKALLTADKRHKAIGEKLDENHPTWKAYEAMRDAYMETELELVETQYMSFLADRDIAVSAITEMLRPQNNTKKLTPADTKFLNSIMDKYYELYTTSATVSDDNTVTKAASMADAEAFAATFNEAMGAKGFDTAKEDVLRKFFDGKVADDVVASVQDLRKRMLITDQNRFTIQGKLREIGAAEVSNVDADLHARTSLVVGRTPILREEDNPYQMRVAAFDADGKPVQLEEDYKGLSVYRTGGTEAEMISIADQTNEIFSKGAIDPAAKDVKIVTKPDGTTVKVYTVSARSDKMSDFKSMEVELRAEVSRTVSGVSSPLQTNVNEFVRGLRQFGISVTPSKMETIIVAMTAQNSRARRRLEQTGNPGYEVQGGIDAATSISRHVDTRAATIAKIALRPKLDRLMNVKSEESRKLWFGDKEKLKRLKDAYDTALSSNAPEDTVALAKLEYFDYKNKMDKTIKVVNGREINQGNKYLSDMHSLMAFVNSNRDVNESDWGSGPVASWVQRWAARAQLGGMMTQPIMNSIGPYTNFVPWLATYNSKTGFGGGAGIAKAYAAYTRAFTDVGVAGMVPNKLGREMNTAEYWDRVATGAEENEYVSRSEAQFIADETRSGILTPAMANSVIGNARGHTTNPLIEKATDAWMYFYQSSEQSTRRAAGLAAFRIAWARQLQKTGKTEAQLAQSPDEYRKAFSAARDFAVDGVNKTLGDYSAPNRPAAWRSGFQSFLYMYKVWTTTSVQTFARLDMTGKALFLIPLLFCSGLSGVPFAEDLEDLIDTLLQKTGTPIGSIRMEIAKQIDAIFPGLSGPILSGPGSALLGADVAGKFGLGDMAPATGMFLAGADIGTTFKEVAGPAFGFLSGLTTGGYLAATAPFSDTTTLVDALREGPITLGRALGDGYAYMSSGAVIDKRGYVITPNASIDMLAARVLGFTPTATASAYGIIAQAKRQTDYQKAKVAIFRQGLLKAELSGDTKTAKSIRQHVKEWNASTKGTALEIKDFEKNYQNLKKRAVLPATKRFLQSTSKSAKDEVSLAIDLYAYD